MSYTSFGAEVTALNEILLRGGPILFVGAWLVRFQRWARKCLSVNDIGGFVKVIQSGEEFGVLLPNGKVFEEDFPYASEDAARNAFRNVEEVASKIGVEVGALRVARRSRELSVSNWVPVEVWESMLKPD